MGRKSKKKKKKKPNYRLQQKADRKRKVRDTKRKKLLLRRQAHLNVDPGPRPSNEVSPVQGITANQYVARLVAQKSPAISSLRSIREEKAQGMRLCPSVRLAGNVTRPPYEFRAQLLDKIAELVDENVFGRSEMCLQFAALLAKALTSHGISAEARKGEARYKKPNGQWFSWDHAWVEYDEYVIDGNVDTMRENPLVDKGVDPPPFWGHRDEIPDDRQFSFSSSTSWLGDEDTNIWWPRLHEWLNAKMRDTTDTNNNIDSP